MPWPQYLYYASNPMEAQLTRDYPQGERVLVLSALKSQWIKRPRIHSRARYPSLDPRLRQDLYQQHQQIPSPFSSSLDCSTVTAGWIQHTACSRRKVYSSRIGPKENSLSVDA